MNNTKRVLAAVALAGAASLGAFASSASAATDPVPPAPASPDSIAVAPVASIPATPVTPDSTKVDMTELAKTPGDRLQDDPFDQMRTSVHDKIIADVQEGPVAGANESIFE
ncbi:hypothetical protein ACLF6K_38410 (plasmid) [Streptomyces xanthophaeus]|uniref:hypothetical protein n=1 Tax=Streptomyces xanthophaeus TaxID=67385 RepID=UPI00398FD151